MSNRTKTIAAAACCVGLSLDLCAFAFHSQRQYALAHSAMQRAHWAATNPYTWPATDPSPGPFQARAHGGANGVCLLAAVSLVAAIKTRHPAWLVCFLLCGLLAVFALITTSVQY